MDFSSGFKRMFLTLAIAATVLVLVANSVESASVIKRSIVRSEQNNSVEECRTNAVCGWEIYNPSTRSHMYYVSSSCKCVAKETCVRVSDDISVPAYIYRCREIRRKTTTARPHLETTTPSS